MSKLTAIYDACVLHPAQLRDLLIRLGMSGEVRARWTDEIHEEWIASVADIRGIPREKLQRTRDLMNQAIRDCLVADYEDLIAGLDLPDSDDRHVLAAAIRCGANVIVTYNLKDFPQSALEHFGIIAQHPDEFVAELLELAPDEVCDAVKRQRESLKNPPLSIEELFTAFETCDLKKTVSALRGFMGDL